MNNLSSGRRLGPYEVVSRIGAGGMGEVWRAVDTRLDRAVAIKVLPAEFNDNAQLQVRFEREAKTISQLNHPNICTLHDVGRDHGMQYLVMELVEGESLCDRLARGPLPLADVLRFGAQIADALDRAHRAGIVHRDLKPGNVMITKAGVKLLDFGLAKGIGVQPLGSVAGTASARASGDGATAIRAPGTPPNGAPLTAEGTIVGTFQYMAPEQLEGIEADARTDIFALGAVLYEMATGTRAFDGKTRTSVIAAIVRGQPAPIRDLQPATSPALEHVVSRALEKDPQDRWQSARDVAEELRWISQSGSQANVPAATRLKRLHRERALAVMAAALLIAAAALAVMYARTNVRASRVVVADLTPPAGTEFNDAGDDAGPPVLSPDGRYVVFSAVDSAGSKLWLRVIASGETRPLSGTDGGMFPFWAPDSRNIGFFTTSNLERVDVDGGAAIVLAPASVARGGSWSKNAVIVYTPATLDTIWAVSANGGKPFEVTKMDRSKHSTHRWPWFLPDGKHFLFLAANHQDSSAGSNGVFIGSIDGGEQRLVIKTPANAVYDRGELLFVRDTTLYAQTMSPDGTLSGEPRPVVSGVLNDRGIWRGGFSVSNDGDLLYCAGQASSASRIVWVDRTGKEIGTVGDTDMYWDVRLSPDQKKLALGIGDPLRQVWIIDFLRNTRTRLDLGAGWAGFPSWSPDGSTVIANGINDNGLVLVEKRLDGSMPRTITSDKKGSVSGNDTGAAVSPDGRTVVFGHASCLWRARLDGSGTQERLTPPEMNAYDPAYSPDGKWIAYVSSENGRKEVFIALARDLTQRWQISQEGGVQPSWRADGKEFYYIDNQNRLTAVNISTRGESLQVGQTQPLFPIRGRMLSRAYDVSRDGQRVIINKVPDATGVGVKLVTNWRNAAIRTEK